MKRAVTPGARCLCIAPSSFMAYSKDGFDGPKVMTLIALVYHGDVQVRMNNRLDGRSSIVRIEKAWSWKLEDEQNERGVVDEATLWPIDPDADAEYEHQRILREMEEERVTS